MKMQIKDEILSRKAHNTNIARFTSFGPKLSLNQRHICLTGYQPNKMFALARKAVAALLNQSPDGVNIRPFHPDQPKGNKLKYGLKSVDEVMMHLEQYARDGLYTIVNETIPIDDGGVSGVVLGDLMEFSPDDTPKCVDKPDACALPRDLGLRLLETVYGFIPDIQCYSPEMRVEFSIHPIRRGIRNTHTIIWETETVGKDALPSVSPIHWPNRFSTHMGDKVFGLLMAHLHGLPVPRTTVVGRRLAPFSFGTSTGTTQIWMRTCPAIRTPGKYPTTFGWQDPFAILANWDAQSNGKDAPIISVMAQESVDAKWSGSLVPVENKDPVIEGVAGRGDAFMVGRRGPETMPDDVRHAVMKLCSRTAEKLGSVEMEWVFDGKRAWVVQLHIGHPLKDPQMIYPGVPVRFHRIAVEKGLDSLRELIAKGLDTGEGIELVGRVGITSHFGDLLRSARIPSRLIFS
jgi:hypothetical protein